MKLLLFAALAFLLTTEFFCQSSEPDYHSKFYSPEYGLKKNYDILDYKLDLNIYDCFNGPYPNSFSASEIITFRCDSTINMIKLNADESSLQIDSVSLAAKSFIQTNDTLFINLDRVYQKDEVVEVKINYTHKDVVDHAFFVKDGMVFTNTASENSRQWFPCWDNPSDKATLNLKAKVPEGVLLGSNGLLADSTQVGDTIIYNWVSKYPVATYLIVIAANKYYNLDVTYWKRNSTDSITIMFYWNPGENIYSLDHIKKIMPDMMSYYSKLFGEYPFEKNGFATMNDLFFFGGMEHQTLISLCPNCWKEELIAHEFAHQWFGDLITCGTWADIWLNESFATYCEALWYEYTEGEEAYLSHIQKEASRYFNNNPGFAIVNPDWGKKTPPEGDLYNGAIIYSKGATVLYMLRELISDSLFFKSLYEYATDENLKYKNAVTKDFINVVNKVSGQDLNWFFDEWLYQSNHPVYENKYSVKQVNGKWVVELTINQTQGNDIFFKMQIDIEFTFADDKSLTRTVWNETYNQKFTFEFSDEPVKLVVDPGNKIPLKKTKTTKVD